MTIDEYCRWTPTATAGLAFVDAQIASILGLPPKLCMGLRCRRCSDPPGARPCTGTHSAAGNRCNMNEPSAAPAAGASCPSTRGRRAAQVYRGPASSLGGLLGCPALRVSEQELTKVLSAIHDPLILSPRCGEKGAPSRSCAASGAFHPSVADPPLNTRAAPCGNWGTKMETRD